ncbi:hypothetical protein P9112_005881 [Eukaryota sp. TZLM1-RC]
MTTSSTSFIPVLCKSISEINIDLAEWEPKSFITAISGPLSNTVDFISRQSKLFGPVGSALGTLFSTIKGIKLNKAQSCVLVGRVLRLTKLTFSPLETTPELAESPALVDVLRNFTEVCTRINTVIMQHDDAKWYKKAFSIEKFRREFEQCNKLLDDFSTELLIGFTGKTIEKLPTLSNQKVEAIVGFDHEEFQNALASHKQMLLKEMRQEFKKLQQKLSNATEASVKAAIEEQQKVYNEQRKQLQKDLNHDCQEQMKVSIPEDELDIDWSTSQFSGQSEVIQAEYRLSNVVIKLYYSSDGISRELAREYSIINSLPSVPSLPRVYGLTCVVKTNRPRYGLVMERLSEFTLKEKVSSLNKETKKFDVLINIGKALAACHECKLLHRDLKPDNILFREGCPVIIDWGSGKNIGNSNVSMSINGNRVLTPLWTSPELVLDETIYTDKIDVFSFALIIIFVLTRESIWQDFEGLVNRDQLVVNALRSGDIPTVFADENLPVCLVDVINECLKFDYHQRPSVSEVVDVLLAFRYKTDPIECLTLNSRVLCTFGLSLIDKSFVEQKKDQILELYGTIIQLLESCYTLGLANKLKSVFEVIEQHHYTPTSLVERKVKVLNVLERRFKVLAELPVENSKNSDHLSVSSAVVHDTDLEDSDLDLEFVSSSDKEIESPVVKAETRKVVFPKITLVASKFSGLLKGTEIFMFGSNYFGQLGNGDKLDRHDPTLIENFECTQLSVGHFHSFAIGLDKRVYGFGNNDENQLNLPKNKWLLTKSYCRPTHIQDLHDIIKVTAGRYCSFFLTKTGEVIKVGNDERKTVLDIENFIVDFDCKFDNLILLDKDGSVITYRNKNFTKIPDFMASSVAAGFDHFIALNKQGKVYCWGLNSEGQLGNGTNQSRNRPIPVESLPKIQAIACGGKFSMALTADRKVYMWGSNKDGRLGLGQALEKINTPELIGLENIDHISAGFSHAFAYGEGELFGWGSNTEGQLGVGDTKTRFVPTKILL